VEQEKPERTAGNTLAHTLTVISAWCVGIFLHFHPTLLSGFALMQAGQIDSRLNNFVLEHTYRWLLRWPNHQDLFAPDLLPSTGLMFGFTDLLLGLAPCFWIWRFVGFDPETSYQLWMMTLASMNFLACFLLLRRFLSVGVVEAAFGSLIFAFNTAQFSRLLHQQLVPQFYVLIAIMALFVVFRTGTSRRLRCSAVFVFFLSWVVQFYSSFYSFFLLGLPFGAVLLWAFFVPVWRKAILRLGREHYFCLVTALLLSLMLMWPLLSNYLQRLDRIGYLPQPFAKPKFYIWFLTDHSNLLYGWIRSGPFRYLQGTQFAQGIGLVTSAAGCAGLFLFRRESYVKLICAGFITTVVLTFYLTNTISIWPFLRDVIPGAKAIRAVCRVGMIQLIPAAIGLALLFFWLRQRRYRSLLVVVGLVCLLEQVNTGSKVLSKQDIQEKVHSLAGQVEPKTQAFMLVPHEKRADLAELAYWVALASRTPTINARYIDRRVFSERTGKEALDFVAKELKEKGMNNVQLIEVECR